MTGVQCYLGLGSNLDQPARQLRNAARALDEHPQIQLLQVSPYYCSRAVGPGPQPDYCNAVASIHTELSALSLLDALQAIEQAQGRDRNNTQRWSARTLDIDILTYGLECIDELRLTVPHVQMKHRNFVLRPLSDLAPQLEVPGIGLIARQLEKLGHAGLRPWPEGDADE